MEKIKVGIIGSKFAANFHYNGYKECPYTEVVAVASPTNAETFCRTRNIPKYYTDYNEMLKEDIDLVSICVPNFLHKETTIAAANAHKHIICDKPLATTIEDAELMLSACKKNNVKLMYAENWLFMPMITRLKEICLEGAIGEILYIKARESHSGSHSIYAQTLKYCGGGALIHMGIHPISMIRWLKGKEVVQTIGKTSGGKTNNLIHKTMEGEDLAIAILTFEDNTFGTIESDYITKGGLDAYIEIYGTDGIIRCNMSQGSPINVYSLKGYKYAIEKAEMTTGWTKPAIDEGWSLGHFQQIAHFVDCVRLNKEPMWGATGEDGLAALKIALAIYKSSLENKTIDMKTFR